MYVVKGHEVVVAKRRPRWDNQTEWTETPVAKLKFIRSAGKWQLYWMRADMKWHEYPGLLSSQCLDNLVQEVANRGQSVIVFTVAASMRAVISKLHSDLDTFPPISTLLAFWPAKIKESLLAVT